MPQLPSEHVKLALPSAGPVASVRLIDAPLAANVGSAEHAGVIPQLSSVVVLAAQGAGTLQVALVTPPHTPLLQAKLALPMLVPSELFSVRVEPLAVVLDAAEQLLPLTDQFRVAPAPQSAGAVQLALPGVPQLPSAQVKVALPVLAFSVLASVRDAPLLADVLGAAEQLAAPDDQGSGVVLAAQGCGGGGTQVALVAAPQTPLVQEKLAEPVVPVESVRLMPVPLVVALDVAEQLLPLTIQFRLIPALQSAAAVQVALVAPPQTPLVQEKLAEPVVGALASVSRRVAPLVAKPRDALQVLLLTVHD